MFQAYCYQNSYVLIMEQFILSSNKALELKLGNYKFILPCLFIHVYIYINIFKLIVRKASDINDPEAAFYPDMTYQVFGHM